jgi:hypothetical protein
MTIHLLDLLCIIIAKSLILAAPACLGWIIGMVIMIFIFHFLHLDYESIYCTLTGLIIGFIFSWFILQWMNKTNFYQSVRNMRI